MTRRSSSWLRHCRSRVTWRAKPKLALVGSHTIETVAASNLSGVRRAADPRSDATILVVDDDPNVSGLVGSILGSSGFIVDSAVDAVEALTRIGQRRPDL